MRSWLVVSISAGDLTAEAVGEIVVDGDVPIIRAIEVRYTLRGIGADQPEKVDRAHAVHHRACAVSRSLEGAIEISTVLSQA